jgi:hypothetical protein
MPTPEGINLVPLHGLYVQPDEDGTPLQGTVTFTPNPAMITFPDQNTIMAGSEQVTLDVNGEFTVNLPCTDTDNQVPDGWGYTVQERLIGIKPRSYFILLPYSSGAVVELSDIMPTDAAPNYIPVTGPQGPPGFVNSVNGKHEVDPVLNAADVGALATSARGAANGVASLDGTTKVPVAQLPDLSTIYLAVGTRGVANGVASLGAGGLIPSTQLDLADTAALAVADAGAIGVSTQLAREDHVHAGVNLTAAQSIAGAKTWTGSAYFTGTELGVGVSASLGGRVDFRTASAGQTILNLQNTSGASTAALLKINGDTSTSVLMVTLVTGDTQNRFALRGSGQLEFGPGNGARDVNFYRSAAGILNSSGQFASDAAAPAAVSHLTRKDYVDGLDGANVKLTGAQTVAGVKTFSSTPIFSTGITSTGAAALNGGGSSSSTGSFTFTRTTGAGEAIRVINSTATGVGIRVQVTSYATDRILTGQLNADTVDPFAIYGDGQMQWGPGGSTARDVTLSRISAGVLGTNGDWTVRGQDRGRGILATITRSAVVNIPDSLADYLLMTLPSRTYVNGRAYRFTVWGYQQIASGGAASDYVLYKIKRTNASGTVWVDSMRIGRVGATGSALYIPVSLSFIMTNTSGADIIDTVVLTGSSTTVSCNFGSASSNAISYITVEDVGLATNWVGAPIT